VQGVFLATTQPLDLRGTAGALRILSCQTPLHSPLSKSLEAACPVHDTHAAGVVTQATMNIVVALKIPLRSRNDRYMNFGERPDK
jgi:hypothetical protein